MSALARAGFTLLGVCLVLALFFLVRYAVSQGRFDSIASVSPGLCRTIAPNLKGAGDLEIDPAHDTIFVSTTDGLYRLKLSDPAAAPVRLAGTPRDFHPGGISLYRGPQGGETLMAIDRPAHGNSGVETYAVSFDGDTARLTQQIAIEGKLLVSPRDLSAIAPDQFYAANDHAATGALGRFAEDYLLWPHADLVLFNAGGLRIAVQRIASAHGVLATPDGRFLYVTAANDRRLLAFSREMFTGNLSEIGSLTIPARLDRISRDDKGNLIVAGETKPGSAQVFRVRLGSDGVPQSYDTIFSDDGHALAGARSAAIQGGHLFVIGDDRMLECAVN